MKAVPFRGAVLFIALVGLLLIGCSHDKRAMKTVTTRASFEMSCPEDELELTVLATEGARNLATQIGATGCDKKAVYVYLRASDTWVANTAITPEIEAEEQAFEDRQTRQIQAEEDARRLEQQQSYQRGLSE
jgi:hypothetical protein